VIPKQKFDYLEHLKGFLAKEEQTMKALLKEGKYRGALKN
jgi:hypothetical protein